MRDVGASRGVLVCTRGYTDGARRRADQFIDARIMEEALEHDYSLTDPCPNCRALRKKRLGSVFSCIYRSDAADPITRDKRLAFRACECLPFG